jgi:hypothetical protein
MRFALKESVMKRLMALLASLLLSSTLAFPQAFPPDGGGGGGGAPSFPLLGADGCTAPPYSFINGTTTGLCRGLAAAWGYDAIVLQADDFETLGYGTTFQMSSVAADPGNVLLSIADSSFNGSNLFMQAPGTGVLYSNFVLTAADFTTGTGGSVSVAGTADQATGAGSFVVTVNSDPSNTSSLTMGATDFVLDMDVDDGEDGSFALHARNSLFSVYNDSDEITVSAANSFGITMFTKWDPNDDQNIQQRVTDGTDITQFAQKADSVFLYADVDGNGTGTINIEATTFDVLSSDGDLVAHLLVDGPDNSNIFISVADNLSSTGSYILLDPSAPPEISTNQGANTLGLVWPTPSTGNNTLTLPDKTGTIAVTSDIPAAPTRLTLASNITTTTTNPGVTTTLTFTPTASKVYAIRGEMYMSSTTAAAGVAFGETAPTADTLTGSCWFDGAASGTSAFPRSHVLTSAATDYDAISASQGIDVPQVIRFNCVMVVGANVTTGFILNYGNETGETTTLYAGSYLEYQVLP